MCVFTVAFRTFLIFQRYDVMYLMSSDIRSKIRLILLFNIKKRAGYQTIVYIDVII